MKNGTTYPELRQDKDDSGRSKIIQALKLPCNLSDVIRSTVSADLKMVARSPPLEHVYNRVTQFEKSHESLYKDFLHGLTG